MVKYEHCRKVGVLFDGGKDIYWTRTEYLKDGDLYNKDSDDPDVRTKYFIGQRFYSKKWGVAYISKFVDDSNAEIVFTGKHTCTVIGGMHSLSVGTLKNPMLPYVHGKGYFGVGDYDSKDKAYQVWNGVIERCYNNHGNKNSTYLGAEMSDEWLNYQVFARDYNLMLRDVFVDDPQLDKDLKASGERGKLYSMRTCCLVPHAINTALQMSSKPKVNPDLPAGVTYAQKGGYRVQLSKYGTNRYIACYKTIPAAHSRYLREKSEYLNELAEKYKKDLPQTTYEALLHKAKDVLNEKY